jgi:hypothetical protein
MGRIWGLKEVRSLTYIGPVQLAEIGQENEMNVQFLTGGKYVGARYGHGFAHQYNQCDKPSTV